MDKLCNKCGIKKDIMYFDRDDRSKTGYKPICKICVSEIIKQYNKSKNKECNQWFKKNEDELTKVSLERED